MRYTQTEQINKWANRALENLYGGWWALTEHQLLLIIEATGGKDDGVNTARNDLERRATTPAASEDSDG